MSDPSLTVFVCKCNRSKKYRLTIDGGSTGQYQLECCNSCYLKEDKHFVIEEEIIS